MGIVKIRHRGASGSTVNGVVQEDGLLTGRDCTTDDFDDYDLAELGCELAMVGDQMCNIPYDIFDLSSLKDVLSLETWNYCLTEEERFHLASYLPDMDQETFILALKELLSGDDLFFGNPLEELFRRLRGGFYSLQVTPVREGLGFLQKQGHHHSLRVYHESMIRKFADMSKAWKSCPSSTTVEEKIRIWNNKNYRKPVLLVDLNASPADEETLYKVDKMVESFPLLKKTSYMAEGPHFPAIDLNTVAINTKPKGKGVLKVITSDHRMQTLPGDSLEPCKRVPKGVLKIKPKGDPFGQPERLMTNPIHTSGFKYPPPISVIKSHEENAGQNLAYLHQIDRHESKNRSLQQPEPLDDGQREEFLKMGVESFSDSHNFQTKKKKISISRFRYDPELREGVFPFKTNRTRMQSDENAGTGGLFNGDNIWLTSEKSSRVLCANLSDSDLKESHLHKPKPMHHTVPGETSRISTVGTFSQNLEQSETPHKDHFDGGSRITSDSKMVSEVERGSIFPITYKRKKACTKFNTTDLVKQPALVTNLEAVASNSTECNLIGKAKTVKIKVKGWNNNNAHYKQGLLNGLRHGSPST